MNNNDERDYSEEAYNRALCPECGTSPCALNASGMVYVKRDGKVLATFPVEGHEQSGENLAFEWLLKHQGQSVDYALKYGGYSIEIDPDARS